MTMALSFTGKSSTYHSQAARGPRPWDSRGPIGALLPGRPPVGPKSKPQRLMENSSRQ